MNLRVSNSEYSSFVEFVLKSIYISTPFSENVPITIRKNGVLLYTFLCICYAKISTILV